MADILNGNCFSSVHNFISLSINLRRFKLFIINEDSNTHNSNNREGESSYQN